MAADHASRTTGTPPTHRRRVVGCGEARSWSGFGCARDLETPKKGTVVCPDTGGYQLGSELELERLDRQGSVLAPATRAGDIRDEAAAGLFDVITGRLVLM